MTTEAIRSDFINFLVEEHSKEKQKSNINNNTKEYNDVETNNKNVSTNLISIIILKLIILTVFIIKKLSLFLYLYIKTLITMTYKIFLRIGKYFIRNYRPTINILDNYLTKSLKYIFELISLTTYNLSIKLYKYGKEKKYYKIKVGEKKYSEMDIARMASGIGDFENLTLKDIQDRFTIGYDTAIKVRDMRNNTLKMLQLLKEAYEKERNNY